mmetsp:Transcript_21946/g.36161  ORF Transcript_21946/g.36161 Transcript_21946/m.36161 type:complete len:85 (-) Transcript_21946:229-483(-)
MQSTWCSYPFLTKESSMEIEYCNSELSRDLDKAKAYWKVLSELGSEVHLEANSSRSSCGGTESASLSSSWRRTERCLDLVVLIF